jgi:hypothetical protein
MNSIRRHLSYANVVATLALLFAMSGGALAAKRYLVNSTKQINPKVLKALEASVARKVKPGAAGAVGKEGTTGKEGPAGKDGVSAPSTLPSGQSESGDYGAHTPNAGAGGYLTTMVAFPVPTPAPISIENVVYTTAKVPVPHCIGPGHAERGYLCIYSAANEGVDTPPSVLSYEVPGKLEEGAGRFGFLVQWTISGAGATDIGSYTVTAP